MLKINQNVTTYPELNFEPNPDFGTVQVPILLQGKLTKQQELSSVDISELQNLDLNPFTATLHYGQSIFEGLKAYRVKDRIGIFRLQDAAARFKRSAEIMNMAAVKEENFIQSVSEYVRTCKNYIPYLDKHSLYLRPLLFAEDHKIKVNSSNAYRFLVMSSIVGDYFAATKNSAAKVLVNKNFVRAFKGGTGEAKTAANYALSLPSVNFAISKGYHQVLYLDAETRSNFEELGGMNFFWVKNGALYTPKLDGQILHGITRKTILEIAKLLNLPAYEQKLPLAELIQGHKDGSISEVFACGTAATVVPIGDIGFVDDNGEITNYDFSPGPIAKQLREYLYETHKGNTELSDKYITYID